LGRKREHRNIVEQLYSPTHKMHSGRTLITARPTSNREA
jgi:hypothetical protein